MTKQALYLKWRPQSFDDVIGQEHVTRTLTNAIDGGRIRHAYLFSGPRGTGKTTTARLLAHALGSQNMDVIEIDAASHTGVDDVRDLRDKIAFMPAQGQYKVYIIDEVHRFSGSAFDALLKTLEEPPEHAIFVLATTEIDKVPDTIKSRCLQFEFRRVAMTEVADRLQFIAQQEGLNIDREALELIARHGTGSVRDSISLLDQIVADPAEHVTVAVAQRILGTASSETVLQLVDAILHGDVVTGLQTITTAMNAGSDPRQFGQQVVEHLRAVLLAQTSSANLIEASDEMRELYTQQAGMVNKKALMTAIRAFNEAVNDQSSGWHPQLALELALVEGVRERPQVAAEAGVQSDAAPVDLSNLELQIEQMIEAKLVGMSFDAAAGSAPQADAQQQPTVTETGIPAASSAPGAVPLAQVHQKWAETRHAVKSKNKILDALLDHVEVRTVNGSVVTLTVKNEVFLDRLNTANHRTLLNYVLTRLHDTNLEVRVVMTGNEGAAGSGDANNPYASFAKEVGGEVRPHEEKRRL